MHLQSNETLAVGEGVTEAVELGLGCSVELPVGLGGLGLAVLFGNGGVALGITPG